MTDLDDMPVPPDIAEARRLVMEHLARKPKRHEVTELESWNDRAHVLNTQLEALLGTTPKKTASVSPIQKDEPMPRGQYDRKTPDPEARLVELVKAYHAAPDSKTRGNRKRTILEIVHKYGLTMPELHAPGTGAKTRAAIGPDKVLKPRTTVPKTLKVPAFDGLVLGQVEIRPSTVLFPVKPLDDIRTTIRSIRSQVWSLLADLERLAPAERNQLAHDLDLLGGAAGAAKLIQEGVA